MQNITIIKGALVDMPEEERFGGIVAFQVCEFVFEFFGKKMTSRLDTKIMVNGDQVVIDGDGYIPAGWKLAA